MFELLISSKAKKKIKLLKKLHQEAIIAALIELKENPLIGKPLTKEFSGKFSLRVGVYRIIYSIDQKDKIIRVLDTGHHANIYS